MTASVLLALQMRNIKSHLQTGDTEIIIDGANETIRFKDSVNFGHKGQYITGNSGVLNIERNLETGERSPIKIIVSGGVEYNDMGKYSAKCESVEFNYETNTASLTGRSSLKGEGFKLDADSIHYHKERDHFKAKGKVINEGITDRIPLLVETSQSGEQTSYILSCDEVEILSSDNRAKAIGNVSFMIETTTIECGKVNLTFNNKEIVEVYCEGKVKFSDPDMTASADKAKYDKATSQLILQSDENREVVVVYRGQEVKGKQVVLDLSNGRELTLSEGKILINSTE